MKEYRIPTTGALERAANKASPGRRANGRACIVPSNEKQVQGAVAESWPTGAVTEPSGTPNYSSPRSNSLVFQTERRSSANTARTLGTHG